mmetsp:Transcript_45775/g.98136  ORF Transcript_45775/g.98136 Transcript_45775/m.98136 type:complete len:205 (-) Transcript_45775:185-799(-)
MTWRMVSCSLVRKLARLCKRSRGRLQTSSRKKSSLQTTLGRKRTSLATSSCINLISISFAHVLESRSGSRCCDPGWEAFSKRAMKSGRLSQGVAKLAACNWSSSARLTCASRHLLTMRCVLPPLGFGLGFGAGPKVPVLWVLSSSFRTASSSSSSTPNPPLRLFSEAAPEARLAPSLCRLPSLNSQRGSFSLSAGTMPCRSVSP